MWRWKVSVLPETGATKNRTIVSLSSNALTVSAAWPLGKVTKRRWLRM